MLFFKFTRSFSSGVKIFFNSLVEASSKKKKTKQGEKGWLSKPTSEPSFSQVIIYLLAGILSVNHSVALLGEVQEGFCSLGITSSKEAGWSEKHCLERVSNAVGKTKRANKHLPSVLRADWQERLPQARGAPV